MMKIQKIAKTLTEAHELIADFKEQLLALQLPNLVEYLEENWFCDKWIEKWLYLNGRPKYDCFNFFQY